MLGSHRYDQRRGVGVEHRHHLGRLAVGGVESEEVAMAGVDREVVRACRPLFTVDAVDK